MDISKTQFKDYCKCENYIYLDNIHKYRGLFDDNKNDYIELLRDMFSLDGTDNIEVVDEQLEVMMPYFKDTEKYALIEASKVLNKKFVYYEKTSDQRLFKLEDNIGNTIFTYVDGCYEDDNEIIIIEVKATTTNKFLKLGTKKGDEFDSIFYKDESIYKLKNKLGKNELLQLNKCFDRTNDCGKYFYDFAITKFIVTEELKKKGINKSIKCYLCVLNHKFTFNGKYINGEPDYFNPNYSEQLISIFDADEILDNYHDSIYNDYINITKNINNKELKKNYSKLCSTCPFEKICFKELNDLDNIKTILGTSKKIGQNKLGIVELINKGVYKVVDVNKDDLLNQNQIIQRNSLDTGKDYFDIEKINEYLNKIKYPVYHLDFESLFLPLPRFKYEHPYSQSVFQFSLHIENEPGKCDRVKNNYFYLPNDFLDHREDLIKELIRLIDLRNGGTVLVYNKTFEMSRIREFIFMFPKYKTKLQVILDHIFDLMDVTKGKMSEGVNFYSKDLHGSYSIKKVLPVFSDLTYNVLDIHNGVEATVAYSKFKYLPKEEIEVLRKELIEYCGLDTYSMVIILNNIKKRLDYEQEKKAQ